MLGLPTHTFPASTRAPTPPELTSHTTCDRPSTSARHFLRICGDLAIARRPYVAPCASAPTSLHDRVRRLRCLRSFGAHEDAFGGSARASFHEELLDLISEAEAGGRDERRQLARLVLALEVGERVLCEAMIGECLDERETLAVAEP